MQTLNVRSFNEPDEMRHFDKGKFEILRIGGLVVGRATYEPGWKWSEHVKPLAGTPTCQVSHVGIVLTGRCMVRMDDGREVELSPGDVFEIGPGHDSWVRGTEAYVSLHLMGGEQYAK